MAEDSEEKQQHDVPIPDSLHLKHLFWKTEWVIPGAPAWKIRGFSRSAYRTGFYLPDLDIALDAGPQCFSKPSHFFVTHTHVDHVACLPLSLIGDEKGNHHFHVHVPKGAGEYVAQYIDAMFAMNAMSSHIPSRSWYTMHEHTSSSSSSSGEKNAAPFDVTGNGTRLRVATFECDHAVPTIGYGFSVLKEKLRPELAGVAGSEIARRRKNGESVTCTVEEPRFAYVCDTSERFFERNAEPTWSKYPVIFVECTFFCDDEVENARNTTHIHWRSLRPVVRAHPDTIFMLFHFSQRYDDAQIETFFASSPEYEPNVRLWTPRGTTMTTIDQAR